MERSLGTLVQHFIQLDIVYREEKKHFPRGIGQRLLRLELVKILDEGKARFGQTFIRYLQHNRKGYENGYQIK